MSSGGAGEGTAVVARARSWRLWVAAVLVAGVVAACGEASVVQGVPEAEANAVVAALDREGVASRKEPDEAAGNGGARFRVTVDPDEVGRAVRVLVAQGLPRRESPGFAETYGAPSLVQSATEERARAAQAVAGELTRSIERIDGVLDARVHLALGDARDALLEDTTPVRSTASVLVRYAGAVAPYDDAAVRRLVAGAVAGMRPDDVTVVGVAHPAAPGATAGPAWVWVGPFAVARRSAGWLRAGLVTALGLNLVLAVAVVFLVMRRRRATGR